MIRVHYFFDDKVGLLFCHRLYRISFFFLKGNAYFYAVFLVISEYMHLGSVVWVRDIISLNNLQPDDVSPI